MTLDLEKFVNESSSIMDLEEKLKDIGVTFSTLKDYIKWLDRNWSKFAFKRAKQVLEQEPKEFRLPTLVVKVEESEYHIHGIVHGTSPSYLPGMYLRTNVKNSIRREVRSFYHPLDGEVYFYEERFDSAFNLLKRPLGGRSFDFEYDIIDCHKDLQKKVREEILGELLNLFNPQQLLHFLISPILGWGVYAYSKTIKNPKDYFEVALYLSCNSLINPRYQQICADYTALMNMPEPLNLEKTHLHHLERHKNAPLFKDIFLHNGRTPSERSLSSARYLRNNAYCSKLKKVHYLCGIGHTSQIAYFLQNPDYSFEKLNSYAQRSYAQRRK